MEGGDKENHRPPPPCSYATDSQTSFISPQNMHFDVNNK